MNLKNDLAEYEKLEGGPVVKAFELLWSNIEQVCPVCESKDTCEKKSETCPVYLALVRGVNGVIEANNSTEPWVGIELDGTLSELISVDTNIDLTIGEPHENMVKLVKDLLERKVKVKIFTPRVSSSNPRAVVAARTIRKWTKKYIGESLEATSEVDFFCITIFSTKVQQVVPGDWVLLENLYNRSINSLRAVTARLAEPLIPPKSGLVN